jgi:hypothetical protein
MAIVVNIPNIGPVTVDNAAQENTLQELVRLTAQASTKSRRSEADLSNQLRRNASAADDAGASMSQLANSSRQASNASSSYYSQLNESVAKSSYAVGDLSVQMRSFASDMLTVPYQISMAFTKAFSGSAFSDPVTEAANALSAGIGLASRGASLLGNVLGKAVGALGLEKIGGVLSDSTDAAAQVVGTVLTDLNQRMATELTHSIKSLAEFNKMGASFSGGIGELRDMASTGGLTLDQFTRVVKNSRENLLTFGGNLRDGSLTLAGYQNYMAKATISGTADGRTFRNELRLMGYTVEEQAEVTASYLANLRMTQSSEQMRAMTNKQVAEGTRAYAADLKILSEFTGKDAKALQERARIESMRGALMSRLDDTQRKSYMDTSSALARFPDSIKGNMEKALVQQLAGGVITDPVIAANAEATQYIRDLAAKIKEGNTNMVDYTIKQTDTLKKSNDAYVKASGGVEDTAAALGATGFVADLANFRNAISGMKPIDADAVERSRKALENQTKAVDDVSTGFIKAQEAAQAFAVYSQNLATKFLPDYSNLISNTAQLTARAVSLIAGALTGDTVVQGKLGQDLIKQLEALKGILSNVGGRAMGGKILAPELSVIGEAGPEAVVPLLDGKTIPVDISGTEKLKSPSQDMSSVIQKLQGSFDTATAKMQRPVPVDLSGLDKIKSPSEDISAVIQQLQGNFAVAASKMQKSATPDQDYKKQELINDLPDTLATALENVLAGPNGLSTVMTTVMTTVKSQMADDNRMQQTIMQSQNERLDTLISAMQDNVRVSERIANELS